MRAHLPEQVALPAVRVWLPGPVLDQGTTPQCVGFSWRQWLSSQPDALPPHEGPTAEAIYTAAQAVDGFDHAKPLPDNSDASGGSSVRAGAKALKAMGLLESYVWASTIDDLSKWILLHGPVVIGINWYESMESPDSRGFVSVGGNILGGHALCVNGYSRITGDFLLPQSWGLGWGSKFLPQRQHRGFFRMSSESMARLLAEDGESVTAAPAAR